MIPYLLTIFLCVVLGWYHPSDTSFNVIGGNSTHVLGSVGACTADLLYQTFGQASWLLVFWSLALTRIRYNRIRVTHIFISLLSFSFILSSNGGFLGTLLQLHISHLFGVLHIPLVFSAIILGFAGLFSLARSVGFCWRRSIDFSYVLSLFKRETAIKNPFIEQNAISQDWNSWTEPTSDPETLEEISPENDVAEPDLPAPARIQNINEFQCPSIDLLDLPPPAQQRAPSPEYLAEQSALLSNVLQEFGIRGEIINIRPGPVVTLFELQPSAGIKTSRVIALADDIARSMSALSARIAVIPGQNAIGIELPNKKRQTVYLRDLLGTQEYSKTQASLPLILGQDIGGNTVVADLAKMPHLLVAGTTGSGKSVSMNAMILSLLYRFSPDACKLIMIDPKMLEFSIYDGIPHLLTPVVTDPKKAVVALKWAVKEMENRYRAMSRLGVRNIDGYNAKLKTSAGESMMRRVQTGFDPETGQPIFENQTLELEPLPYIVVVVDEMADLMLVAGKEIEAAVQRLAQMARAAGIHLIMATQRPSVDVITGTIKANFPTRISFQVTSKIDSRTILSEQGAEQLLGQGDMLFMAGGGRISRVHGPFMKDNEVERIVNFLKAQIEPTYIETITIDEDNDESDQGASEESDALYQEAVNFIRTQSRVSISLIQRRFQIGYNRSARIVEQMEKNGIVTPANHTGKREIIQ